MLHYRDTEKRKGVFTRIRLSVAETYLYPRSQRLIYVVGGLIGLFALFLFTRHFFGENGELISSGALSSSHALLGSDCRACHNPFNGIDEQKCISCHERFGGGNDAYLYTTHVKYRSEASDRLREAGSERSCSFCHQEHRGRQTGLTLVDDIQCLLCHDGNSFIGGHPDFPRQAGTSSGQSQLVFVHTLHVNEIRRREQLVEIERTCFYCHHPGIDGKAFQPVSFESSCSSCHLKQGDLIHRTSPYTDVCSTCHIPVEEQIVIPQSQRIWRRAEFDHSVHFLQVPCLDCHNVIPIRESAASGTIADTSRDRANILNLPTIQTCRVCHTGNTAPQTCITCHLFHPERPTYNNLRLRFEN